MLVCRIADCRHVKAGVKPATGRRAKERIAGHTTVNLALARDYPIVIFSFRYTCRMALSGCTPSYGASSISRA